VLLVLVLNPLDVCGRIFVEGATCRCVETCNGGKVVKGGVFLLFISMFG
jgi:hypothetical protein